MHLSRPAPALPFTIETGTMCGKAIAIYACEKQGVIRAVAIPAMCANISGGSLFIPFGNCATVQPLRFG